MDDLISKVAAINALTEENIIAHLDSVYDSELRRFKRATERIIVQLPSEQPTLYGYNIKHLELIARVLQKENLPPEKVVEALTNIDRVVTIVMDEFKETLRKAHEYTMEEFMYGQDMGNPEDGSL